MKANRSGAWWVLLSGLLAAACGSSAVRQPPGKPPSPQTVSIAEPGGDAHDPHEAALLRQLEEPWGRRNDRDDQVHVPTPDWEHWKRVRYWGVEHFAGWRYGDDHHVIALLFVHDVPAGEANDSESCLKRFDAWARPQARAYEVRLEPGGMKRDKWREQPILIKWIDGHVDLGFRRRSFSAAWTAYPAYPETCLIYAVGIPWDGHEALAKKVRDRWVAEAFPRMAPLTSEKPVRK
jgi:hypothetical protein